MANQTDLVNVDFWAGRIAAIIKLAEHYGMTVEIAGGELVVSRQVSEAFIASAEVRWQAVSPAAEAQEEPDDTDLTETDIDRMMTAGIPVQIVTAPPDTHGAEAQQPGTLRFPAPGPAPKELRIRVLREILARIDGSRGDGDSATEDVSAATVRAVLAEILADMQPAAADPRRAADAVGQDGSAQVPGIDGPLLYGAAEVDESPRLNVAPLTGDALTADEAVAEEEHHG